METTVNDNEGKKNDNSGKADPDDTHGEQLKKQNEKKDAPNLEDFVEPVSSVLRNIKNSAGRDININVYLNSDSHSSSKKDSSSIFAGDIINSTVIIGDDNQVSQQEYKSRFEQTASVISPVSLEDAFHNLGIEQQVFFITMCFFEGLKVSDYNQVYRNILNTITGDVFDDNEKRELDRNFYKPNPVVVGLEIVQDYDQSKLAKIYKYKDPATVRRLLNFVFDNYSNLILDYVIALYNLIISHRDVQIRRYAVFALCELSKVDFNHVVQNAIKPLATSSKDVCRVSVAYFYEYLFDSKESTNSEIRKRLIDILDGWIKNSNWTLKWTATAVCERLGLSQDKDVVSLSRKNIEILAGCDNMKVAGAVIHALVTWSLKKEPEYVFNIVNLWIDGGSAGKVDILNEYEIRCVVGIWTFWRILAVNRYLLRSSDVESNEKPNNFVTLFWNSNGELAPLLSSVGIRSFEYGLGNEFLNNIASLLEYDTSDEIQSLVIIWVKNVYQQLPSTKIYRKTISGMVKNYWANSKNIAIKNVSIQLQGL